MSDIPDPKALIVDHQQWLRNPFTQHALNALRLHEEKLISLVANKALPTDGALEDVYYYATCLRQTRALIEMLTKPDIMIKVFENKTQ